MWRCATSYIFFPLSFSLPPLLSSPFLFSLLLFLIADDESLQAMIEDILRCVFGFIEMHLFCSYLSIEVSMLVYKLQTSHLIFLSIFLLILLYESFLNLFLFYSFLVKRRQTITSSSSYASQPLSILLYMNIFYLVVNVTEQNTCDIIY